MSDDGIVITEGAGMPANTNPEQNVMDAPVVEAAQPNENVVQESVVAITPPEISDEVEPSTELPVSAQKRINKMHAAKRSAEARALQLENINANLQAELKRIREPIIQSYVPVDPYAPVEPNENDTKYNDNPKAYMRDYVNYQKNNIIYENRQAQLGAYQQQKTEHYNKLVNIAREQYEDFDETIQSLIDLPIAPNQQTDEIVATLQEVDNAADVAYYLGKNPDDFMRLLKLSSRLAAIELGKISAKISTPSTVKSNAPPPPKNPKGLSGSKPQKSLIDLSIDDMAKSFRSMR